ncbi:hypothetical protein BDV95DRAFT_491620 [Massariosphaeria phaeospora]|uniref:Ankyrin repeat protein nuc-2 n=1 Tax=Massariosphaeria phaeospora TaxID=100035 RepID=A0A7C8MBI1_9PLEO|nr:hypothetical protein BDV95DRAFT_491620 [Massariosphaeria phaeospora]
MDTTHSLQVVVLRKSASSTSLASKDDKTDSPRFSRKFGKHIQKRQLDIPEYAASFVDYKALKKLIKRLSATPIIPAQGGSPHGSEPVDPQTSLQANKATFFFRVERELEKVNTFYLQKEAELRLRLATLLDKKKVMQQHPQSVSKISSRYIALEEGLKQFSMDLNKLEQFVEVNATAFSKILKKWDKTSKSREKQLYLSRAVEVQPCFNRDVISTLSDQATQALLDFSGWAEGDKMQAPPAEYRVPEPSFEVNLELDNQIIQAINTANTAKIEECLSRLSQLQDAQERISRAFLSTVDGAPEAALKIILDTKQVNLQLEDEINERNCLHKAAICGRGEVLRLGLNGGVDVHATDVYGRIPLHYASMHGHVELVQQLITAAPDTVNFRDQDSFTPLIHAIVHSQLPCVQTLLSKGTHISRLGPSEHIPLNLACQYASLPIVELLLERHAELLPDAEGLYPQHLVARSGKSQSSEVIHLLQKYHANLNEPDKLYQWTPLFHAASEGHVECLKTLLQCGVDGDVVDEKGLSAMYYATWEGHLECMQLLASVGRGVGLVTQNQVSPQINPPALTSTMPGPMELEGDGEGIPEFILPPPIIPFKRYGHNFLDTKTFVVISFDKIGKNAIEFYDDQKYPAARLTISSKSSDLIPRNILLPIQDEFKIISFQIENLDTFSIDFDIYPTFGSRVIARSVASSKVFTDRASSCGQWHLELFDPRLRTIGRITFDFQVVKPFHGIPLEITHFATYWKATSQLDSQPHSLITGSSLSGEYVRLFVQLTADGVPILYPRWKINHQGLEVPVNILTYTQLAAIGARQNTAAISQLSKLHNATSSDIPTIHETLASSFTTLKDALSLLPTQVHVELHVLFPSRSEEEVLKLGPTHDMNVFADKILLVVFEHARILREQGAGEIDGTLRSVVFSSLNQDICTVLNWKQPNYPVLLCNELDADSLVASHQAVQSSGRTTISVKEAVQIARDNNFMGLICSSRLLDLAPALIESIKTAGLVLVTDVSDAENGTNTQGSLGVARPRGDSVPNGVDGVLRGNGGSSRSYRVSFAEHRQGCRGRDSESRNTFATKANQTTGQISKPKWRRRFLIAGGGLVTAAAAVTVSDDAQHLVTAVQRSSRVVSTLFININDYRNTLKRDNEPDYDVLLKECHLRCAKRTLRTLESNGSIYIKLGQHLSSMNYLLPSEWCDTFIPLQDKCPISSYESIEAMVLKDTGRSLSEFFSEFERLPIGAASLAQVHRAVVKETGQKVAVKVQHPALDEWAQLDLALTRFSFKTLKRWFPEYDLTWLSEEMQISLPQELDFEQEGHNAVRARKYFENVRDAPVTIPQVLWGKRRILVMEYVSGHRPDDLEYLDSHNIDRDEVSAALARVFNEMIFGKNAPLHCDPHGGNIAIRHNPSRAGKDNFDVILYDHGLYRDIPSNLRRSYAKLWLAVLDADEPKMRKYAYEVAGIGDEHFHLFASAITGRDYSVVKQNVASARSTEEKETITSALSEGMLESLIELLGKMPRVMLLILKTNDLTRSLDENLHTRQGPARTFLILARYASRTVYQEQLENLSGSLFRLSNLLAFLRAWSAHKRIELKLGTYETYLKLRALLGMEKIV